MWARRARKLALLQLATVMGSVAVSVARDRIGLEAALVAMAIPLTAVVMHQCIRSVNENERKRGVRVMALTVSALALAMAVGYVTALDPEVKMPFSQAQQLLERGRR